LARRILLADDSVTAQNMGRRILTDAGYEVVTVNNGSAALKKIAENKPDLIVLDVYMPGYGGLEVCQRVKENPETRQIPVLLTVGKLEPFKADEARRVGADSFIIKPFEATELLTVLTKLEDKIVAQPQPQKSGRFAKALAAVEQSDTGDRFGDKETGWKNRLTIPIPHAKPKGGEDAAEVAATSPPDEASVSDARGSEPSEAIKPVEPQGFERPIPAGLPADITPEEIAAITAAAAAFGGKTEQPSAAVPETSVQDAVAGLEVASPVVAATQPSAETPAPAPEPPQAAQAAAPAETVPDAIVSAEAAKAEAQVQQSQAEQQPASEALPGIAANSEASLEAQISQPIPPVPGDAEVMAAIASLAPGNGSNGTGHEVPAAAYSPVIAAQLGSGPRWIAEPVQVGLEESKLALDQEMEQVHATQAVVGAGSFSAAAVASSSPVAVVEPVEPATAAQETATESAPATESLPPAFAAEASGLESGVSQSAFSEPTAVETSAAHVQPPVAVEASAYAAAASAGAGTDRTAPLEALSATNLVSENNATAIAHSAPQREAELAAAWQNWKQIRESFVSSQPASASADAAAAEAAVNSAPLNDASTELDSKQEQTAAPVQSASAEAAAEPEAEEAVSDIPEESRAIASIVDNMLAELRPKLVEEIAKKMSSEKKEKDKKKKR
jgi:CheY-like chemotaxis protein